MTEAHLHPTETKRKRRSVVPHLQSQLQSLLLLLQQETAAKQAAHEVQLLLAEAILLHKVCNKFVQPLQAQWLEYAASSSSIQPGDSWLSQSGQFSSGAEWPQLLDMAARISPILQQTIVASTAQLQGLQGLSVEEGRQLTMVAFKQLLMLNELLVPERYPTSLITVTSPASAQASDKGGASGGSSSADNRRSSSVDTQHCLSPQAVSPAAAAASAAAAAAAQQAGADAEALQPDVAEAASVLLANLQHLQAVVLDVMTSGGLVYLHSPHTLISLQSMDLSTGQQCAPPGSHYLHAARRLKLTSAQIRQLQLMRKQYDRMALQQQQAGLHLVGLSQGSFGLQAALSAVGSPGTGGAMVGSSSQDTLPDVKAADPYGELEGVAGGDESLSLEQLLQVHVRDRLDMMKLVALWCMNTLTQWQTAQFFVACWPYHAYLPALVELSPFLTPDDSKAVQINAAACEDAAKAAALAEELGYLGAHGFMQRRHEGLEAMLQWALEHLRQ